MNDPQPHTDPARAGRHDPLRPRSVRGLLVSGLVAVLGLGAAQAAPILTITPITWNVIGLDSNNVNVGPDLFPVGGRVCNVGDQTALNVTGSFVRDTYSNPYMNLAGPSSFTYATLPAGPAPAPSHTLTSTPANCVDVYFNIQVTRTSAAYSQLGVTPQLRNTQPYRIVVTAQNATGVATPAGRELYVEKLISQNRNFVTSFTGPANVYVGGTYRYTLRASTATQGYEQLENFPAFPTNVFQIQGISTTYTSPTGAVNSTVYADACGWENNPNSVAYHNNLTCIGPANYGGAKAGGDIVSTYTVRILSGGNNSVSNVIYDYSGSSYHYNSDFGSGVNALVINAQNAPDLTISKTRSAPFALNQAGTYTLTVSNLTGNGSAGGRITVTDVLPAGLTYNSASGTNWSCTYTAATRTLSCLYTGATLAAGSAAPPITLSVTPTVSGIITNTASVTHTDPNSLDTTLNIDANTANNSGSNAVLLGATVGGTVFEDLDGIGDPLTASDSLKSGVTARVWRDNGDGVFNPATDFLVGTVTTNASGQYATPVDVPNATYWTAVNSREVTPVAGYTSGSTQGNVWAEQVSQCDQTGTSLGCTRRFGGRDATLSDNFGTSYDHVARVDVVTTSVGGINFGFNFNTVTNTRAGDATDDDTGAARSVQGSLRQFIQNANGIAGANVMRFVPAVPATTSGVLWEVNVTTALPAVTDALTTIDGAAFSTTDGTTVRDTNAGQLGTSGTVGTDALALAAKNRPELQIRTATAIPVGLDLQANTPTVRGVAILGFGTTANDDSSANLRLGNNFTGAVIERVFVGVDATRAAFDCPTGGRTGLGDNVRSVGADGGILRDSLLGCAAGKGFGVENASNDWTISGNEIRGNGIGNANLDGIDFEAGSARNTARGNLIVGNEGVGIDMFNGGGANRMENNTITGNGTGTGSTLENPGVRLFGNANVVYRNVIGTNGGAGVMVQATSVGNTISQNSIFANGTTGTTPTSQIGIDLLSSTDNVRLGTAGYVTRNDGGDTDAGGNDLLNFPVISGAVLDATNLIITGFARPGAILELFVAAADPSGFGEGRTYLVTRTEGSAEDQDTTSGTYGTATLGTDTTNRFRFTVPRASLAGVGLGTVLTATATCTAPTCTSATTGGTSEFSNTLTVVGQPQVTLTKSVRNVTQSGTLSTTALGRPGEVLEYCIDYTNGGLGPAAAFTLTDTIAATTQGNLSGYGAGLGVRWIAGGTTTLLTSTTDTDAAGLTDTTLTFRLPSVVVGGSGQVCFRVTVR